MIQSFTLFPGVIYAVSGPVGEQPSQGFTIDIDSGEILDRWTRSPSSSSAAARTKAAAAASSLPSSAASAAPIVKSGAGFGEMPHDVEVSPVSGDVYVAQVNEGQMTKFIHDQY